MPIIMILIRLVITTTTGRLTHLTGKQCSKSLNCFKTIIQFMDAARYTRRTRKLSATTKVAAYIVTVPTDHSSNHCVNAFTNVSGCLHPQLGQLGDNGDDYRRWQQRMRSHRRRDHSVGGGNTRSSSTSDRRRNSSRHNDNSRNRNYHGGNTHAPSKKYFRKNGKGDYQHGSPHNNGNTALLQLGQYARNTGIAPRSLTVYQPNNGTPPAPASAG